jgi:hypothetical protein
MNEMIPDLTLNPNEFDDTPITQPITPIAPSEKEPQVLLARVPCYFHGPFEQAVARTPAGHPICMNCATLGVLHATGIEGNK